MRYYGSLLALLFVPMVAMSHEASECIVDVGTSNGLFSLSNTLLIIGFVLTLYGARKIWKHCKIPEKYIKPILLGAGVALFIMAYAPWFSLPTSLYASVSALLLGVFIYWVAYEDLEVEASRSVSLVLFVVWSGVAVIHSTAFVGFFAILALASAMSLYDPAAIEARDVVASKSKYANNAIFIGTCTLAFYVIVNALSFQWYPVEFFETGAIFMGGVIASLGLLHNCYGFQGQSRFEYWRYQALCIAFAMITILVGAFTGSSGLEKIGGTFLFFYIIVVVSDIARKIKEPLKRAGFIILAGAVVIASGLFLLENAEFYGSYFYLL